MVRRRRLVFAAVLSMLACGVVHADEQSIPPGVPEEGEVAVDTGADGICNSTAIGDDLQLAPVGGATPHLGEIGCGADGLVGSSASGDDVQLRVLGSFCGGSAVPVVDTGADGIASSVLGGDDMYLSGMAFGTAPANTACIGTGPNALNGTAPTGDDVALIGAGLGAPGQPVVLCGDDLIPSTTANNANPSGDDTQEIPVSGIPTCGSANDVVVRSGPINSISDTQAEGPELVIRVGKPLKIVIGAGRASASKTLKVYVANEEFGVSAPLSRTFRVDADDANCPDGTISLVDADTDTPGIQAAGTVEIGGKATATMVATFHADRVRTVSKSIPLRCEINVTAVATDTAPEADDARVRRNNRADIDFEVFDYNDLP